MFLLLLLLAGLQGVVAVQTRPLTSREFGTILTRCRLDDDFSEIFNTNDVIGNITTVAEEVDSDGRCVKSKIDCSLNDATVDGQPLNLGCYQYYKMLYRRGSVFHYDYILEDPVVSQSLIPVLLDKYTQYQMVKKQQQMDQLEREYRLNISNLATQLRQRSASNTESSVNIN